jgi:diaminohydroxyphosphoribosylaminopyrimidine deaminase/5-amino-6-(5-phosphoribosylamino)uracil reductase
VPGEDSAGFLRNALERLASMGILSLVVEGGPTLHRAFWSAGLVDRVQMLVTPIECKGLRWDALPVGSVAALADRSATPLGEDILVEGYVHGID